MASEQPDAAGRLQLQRRPPLWLRPNALPEHGPVVLDPAAPHSPCPIYRRAAPRALFVPGNARPALVHFNAALDPAALLSVPLPARDEADWVERQVAAWRAAAGREAGHVGAEVLEPLLLEDLELRRDRLCRLPPHASPLCAALLPVPAAAAPRPVACAATGPLLDRLALLALDRPCPGPDLAAPASVPAGGAVREAVVAVYPASARLLAAARTAGSRLTVAASAPAAEGLEELDLRPLHALELGRGAPAALALNPHIEGELAILTEDGGLLTVSLDAATAAPPREGPRAEGVWRRCEYGGHPRLLLHADAHQLQACDLRAPGARAAALWTASQVSESERLVSFVQAPSEPFQLAVCSSRYLLLLDRRHCAQPLLVWAHNQYRHPPRLLCSQAWGARRLLLSASVGSGRLRLHEYETCPGSAAAATATAAPRWLPASLPPPLRASPDRPGSTELLGFGAVAAGATLHLALLSRAGDVHALRLAAPPAEAEPPERGWGEGADILAQDEAEEVLPPPLAVLDRASPAPGRPGAALPQLRSHTLHALPPLLLQRLLGGGAPEPPRAGEADGEEGADDGSLRLGLAEAELGLVADELLAARPHTLAELCARLSAHSPAGRYPAPALHRELEPHVVPPTAAPDEAAKQPGLYSHRLEPAAPCPCPCSAEPPGPRPAPRPPAEPPPLPEPCARLVDAARTVYCRRPTSQPCQPAPAPLAPPPPGPGDLRVPQPELVARYWRECVAEFAAGPGEAEAEPDTPRRVLLFAATSPRRTLPPSPGRLPASPSSAPRSPSVSSFSAPSSPGPAPGRRSPRSPGWSSAPSSAATSDAEDGGGGGGRRRSPGSLSRSQSHSELEAELELSVPAPAIPRVVRAAATPAATPTPTPTGSQQEAAPGTPRSAPKRPRRMLGF